jgi:hypothetical protein
MNDSVAKYLGPSDCRAIGVIEVRELRISKAGIMAARSSFGQSAGIADTA